MNTEVKIPDGGEPIERTPWPIVGLPRPGIPGIAIAALAILAALLLFLMLDAQRRSVETTAEVDRTRQEFAPPPTLVVPQDVVIEQQPLPRAVPAPAVIPIVAPPPRQLPPPLPPPIQEPMRQDTRPLPQPVRPIGAPPAPRQSRQSDSALVIDTGGGEIAVGTLIPAVLETPIDTSRPGLARAIVSRDTLGADGGSVVVPRGSRLIGEYQSDVRAGQNRVLVNWTRLIRPDGTAVRLTAPAADEAGGAGIPGTVNTFFLSRFLNAALQTALTVGGNLVSGGTSNTIIVGMPNAGAAAVAGQGLISSNERRPRIRVKQGTLFNVFVARDVDFAAASAADPTPAARTSK